MTEQIILTIFFFVTGAVFGSFFNVCIFRIPKKRSLIMPGSYCPKCKKPIMWYDNVPILSYVLLLGKCRKCRKPISIRYPLIEALTGILFMLLFLKLGLSVELLRAVILTGFLIVISFIDLDTKYIFEKTTVPLAIIGLALSFLNGGNFWDSVLGIITGAGILYLIGLLSLVFFKKEGMGGGDVFLAGAIGAFLGWKGVVAMLFLSFIIGALVSLVMMVFKVLSRKDLIPFGPYISASAVLILFFGERLIYLVMPLLPRD